MDHVAIDLGGRESQICIRGPDNQVRVERRLPTSRLKAFFAELKPSRVIVETCAEAFAVAVDAKEAGHDVRVVPATLVRALGVGQRGIKTDVRDARCLSEASVRMELGSVHVPSAHARELKAVCTLRDALVRSRTVLVNGVRGWMRGQLLRVGSGSTPTFTRRVRTYFDLLQRELPPYVERQLLAIDALTEQILASDLELEFLAHDNEQCRRVMTIPGVGPATAVRFVASIDEISRFKTAHELESYFGLTPGELSSSDTKHRTGITKAGSAAVRWLLVQAAWAAWRTRPNDPMVLWARALFERKKSKVIAIAALARKIAGVMFALLRDQSTYDPLRASTVRPPEAATVLASGKAVTAISRAATPEVAPLTPKAAPAPAASTKPSRASTRTAASRSAKPSKQRSSAGWDGKSDVPTASTASPKAARSPRARRTRGAPRSD